jgi:hypothetical protein
VNQKAELLRFFKRAAGNTFYDKGKIMTRDYYTSELLFAILIKKMFALMGYVLQYTKPSSIMVSTRMLLESPFGGYE